MTFKSEKFLVYVFLILYIISSQILLPFFGKSEIFPVFQWTLFSRCNPTRNIPEIEISLSTTKKITNRQFPRCLQWKVFFLLHPQLETKNKNISSTSSDMALNEVSKFIKYRSFHYKLFSSRVNLIEYAKKSSLEKQHLLKEGIWKSLE